MKMKIITKVILPILIAFIVSSCNLGEHRGPFNYTLIKSKLDLTEDQTEKFDNITSSYLKKLRAVFESSEGGREEKMKKAKVISGKQDAEIKSILDEAQYAIYEVEIKIEREGREKHNMTLIRDALQLDSTQTVTFDIANLAFYTTLRDNHDYYHGKPDVYKQYYKEIDLSRQKVFKELMDETKYAQYKQLEGKYKIGTSEH
jgi:hypothetical protein